jgi:hypothetical protein
VLNLRRSEPYQPRISFVGRLDFQFAVGFLFWTSGWIICREGQVWIAATSQAAQPYENTLDECMLMCANELSMWRLDGVLLSCGRISAAL